MRILKECYQEALELLSANREVMDQLAAHLIEKKRRSPAKEFMQIYRQAKGLPQEEPEQTAGAQMKAAEQTADTANPESVRFRKQLWHSTCIGHRHRSAAAVFHAEAMGRVRTPAAGKRRQLFLGRYTAAGDAQQPADPSEPNRARNRISPGFLRRRSRRIKDR